MRKIKGDLAWLNPSEVNRQAITACLFTAYLFFFHLFFKIMMQLLAESIIILRNQFIILWVIFHNFKEILFCSFIMMTWVKLFKDREEIRVNFSVIKNGEIRCWMCKSMTLINKNQTNLNFKWNCTYCIIRIKGEKLGFFKQCIA